MITVGEGATLMTISNRVQAAVVGGVLAIALVACGGSDGGGSASPLSLGDAAPGNAQDSDRPDECALLTESEVTQVIGPNDRGAQDYAFGGCVWTASSKQRWVHRVRSCRGADRGRV
jgi:hypothetical protein